MQRPHVAMSSAAQAATAIATAAAAEAVELLPGLQGLVGKGYKALLLDQVSFTFWAAQHTGSTIFLASQPGQR